MFNDCLEGECVGVFCYFGDMDNRRLNFDVPRKLSDTKNRSDKGDKAIQRNATLKETFVFVCIFLAPSWIIEYRILGNS